MPVVGMTDAGCDKLIFLRCKHQDDGRREAGRTAILIALGQDAARRGPVLTGKANECEIAGDRPIFLNLDDFDRNELDLGPLLTLNKAWPFGNYLIASVFEQRRRHCLQQVLYSKRMITCPYPHS